MDKRWQTIFFGSKPQRASNGLTKFSVLTLQGIVLSWQPKSKESCHPTAIFFNMAFFELLNKGLLPKIDPQLPNSIPANGKKWLRKLAQAGYIPSDLLKIFFFS